MRSLLRPNSSDLRLFLTPSNRPALTPFLVSLLLLGGCGGGDGIILPGDGEPADITVVDGDEQRGRVGEPLNDPLVVQVTDTRGRPVQGATVAFELTSAGSEVVPHEKGTDANGRADARVVLGTTVGRQTGNARVVTQEGRPPLLADFSAIALSENANSMAALAGQDQSGHVGSPLDDRLVVSVTDGFGNPVEGVPISWVAEGGGSVSDAVVETDENGQSWVERTLGPTVGQQTTLASSEGLAGSPVTFVHTALAGDASRLVVVSGNGQTATVGSALPADLVVRLVDADGNGVPATAVSWVVATGGGRADPENSTTDDGGQTSGRWTLGEVLGEQRLDAVVSGIGVASFRATATAGAPASLVISTQPSASAQNGVPFEQQPVIQVRDARGNDVSAAGIPVSVVIGSGGGELSGTRQRSTDPTGRATFTGLAISGAAGRRTLAFSASGLAGVTSNEIDVTAIGTTTTITGDSPDPSVAGSVVTVNFEVTSSGGTPTSSVTVTVTGSTPPPPCTVTLSNGTGTCQFTLDVVGDRIFTATYSGAPGFAGSQDTEPHTVVPPPPPPPQNKTPKAEFDVACSDLTCTFTDKSSDDDGSIVSRSWNYGDGTSGAEPSHSYAVAGTYQVTLTVTDNGGAVDSKTHDAKPKAPPPQNQPPTAAFTSNCVNLACSFNSGGSSDSDGNVVGWNWTFGDGTNSGEGNPSHTYALGGPYTVTLTVMDDVGAQSAPVSHTITVIAPNAPPQGQGDSYSTSEDTQLTVDAPGVLVNDSDSNGDGLTAVNASDPPNGTVALSSNGSFVYTPNPNFNGNDSFTYQASDGSLQSGQVTVTVSVSTVNDPPVAEADAYTTPGSDQALTVSAPGVLSNDSDPDVGTTLTAQDASVPSQGGAVTLSPDGSFTYTPIPGATGQDSFTYTASDGALTSTATVTITIQ